MMDWTQWHPASNGAGPRHWFVAKGQRPDAILEDKRGHYRRFGSYESAKRAADAANRGEAKS